MWARFWRVSTTPDTASATRSSTNATGTEDREAVQCRGPISSGDNAVHQSHWRLHMTGRPGLVFDPAWSVQAATVTA